MRRDLIPMLAGAVLVGWVVVIALSAGESRTFAPSDAQASAIADVYDPVKAGEPTPDDFRQLLSRDSIRPIYDPRFVPAAESNWTETTVVIGVEVNGDARAYSVAHLGRREMVNDTVGGEPLLVTW